MISLQSPSLPFDVLTEIISHSDLETDVPTLRALSMTCRATAEPSQRRLFNTIEILVIPHDCDETQPIYSTLNDIFNSSPHLATYVSHLVVEFRRPYPATSCIVPALEKLSLIQSLRIKYPSWVDSPEESPRWGEIIGAILRHSSLRRLDLEDRGLLPSIVWQLPALTSIDLAGWRIEELGINYARHSLTRRLAMTWDMSPRPQRTLRSFLKISPRLIHLRLTQNSELSMHSHFMGLSREIIDSPQTLATLKTLTIFFIFYSFILPVGISAELRELSLSNGSVLERIRFDLQCETGLTSAGSLFEYLKWFKLNQVQWSGFSRLKLVEVEIDMFMGGVGLPADPEPSAFNGDLERGVREIFRRAMNRADVEVSVTLYLNSKRPGGDTFRPVLSWERFATLSSD